MSLSARLGRAQAAGGGLLSPVYLAYVAGSFLARALPEQLAYGLAESAGALVARFPSRRRLAVSRNLARVTGHPLGSPGLDDVVRAAYRSYGRYWLETFRLVRADKGFFLERFHCRGADKIDAVCARGKGALVVVGHLGNWDAAGGWAGATGRPVVTVAEVVEPRRLFEWFARHRARLGITILPAIRGITSRLVEAIEAGRVVAILGDRDLSGRGPSVTFFGEETTFPSGPAALALRTGVPILVAGVYGTLLADGRRGWEAEVGDPIELPHGAGTPLKELTQRVATEIEHFVAMRPEEWHVFQPFWTADRGRARTSP